MTRANIIVALLCGALASGAIGCGRPPPDAPLTSIQGTTQIYAENLVSALVELQQVSADIDGGEVGGLQGEGLGRGSSEPLHLATAHLTEGEHTLTIHARVANKNTAEVLVLNATQTFSVGREPVSLLARLSGPTGGGQTQIRVDFTVDGGTLDASMGPGGLPASCHALAPDQTEICVTETMLREAIGDHDAPRVVCIDDALTEMRKLVQFNELDSEHEQPVALFHETEVKKDMSFRIAALGERARRCPSAKEVSVLLDAPEDAN